MNWEKRFVHVSEGFSLRSSSHWTSFKTFETLEEAKAHEPFKHNDVIGIIEMLVPIKDKKSDE